jgi:hypothetical protein
MRKKIAKKSKKVLDDAKMLSDNDPSKIVHGEPTKDFFISMLIKDITLRDAIGDLVDNSVDAIKAKSDAIKLLAKKDKKKKENKFGGKIEIKFDDTKFTIIDNGSGIEEEIAREYAFKMGKPENHQLMEHSIGRFGIGMKRAFFKLGDMIVVESKAPTSSFKLTIPVPKWRAIESDWDFVFDSVQTAQNNDLDTTFTKITITNLSTDAQESFKRAQFENELKDEIAEEQILNIAAGLSIKINGGKSLKPPQLTLKFNKDLVPVYWKHTFNKDKVTELDVEIFAGVSDEIEAEGGWNIFCNDRLILAKNQSAITGWTGQGGDGVANYHQQFWGFRGYVFFNSKRSSSLPWNTTKTGIDPDSSDYLAVRKRMIEIMKDIFLLLNRQKKEREKDNPEKNQALNNKINSSKVVSIINIIKEKGKLSPKFVFPQILNAVRETDQKNIKYTVPIIKFNKVKKRLGASSPADVGSRTFDYYYENEINE